MWRLIAAILDLFTFYLTYVTGKIKTNEIHVIYTNASSRSSCFSSNINLRTYTHTPERPFLVRNGT